MAVWGTRQTPIRPDKLGALLAAVVTLGAVGGAAVAQADADKPPATLTPIAAPLECASSPASPSGAPADPSGTGSFVPPVPSEAAVCGYAPAQPLKILCSQQAAAIVAMLNNAPTTSSSEVDPPSSCYALVDGIRGGISVAPGPVLVTFRYGTRPDVSVKLTPTERCGVFAANGMKTAQVDNQLRALIA